MKKFLESLRKNAKNIVDFEKKKMLPITKKKLKSYKDAEVCYIYGKRFIRTFLKDRNYRKVGDHCHYTGKYRGAAHSICNLRFNWPNKIPVVFHNGPNYDYRFIIKELANEFQGKFGKNTKRYGTFFVLMEKEIRKVNKDGNEDIITISYKTKFIDSASL